MRGVIVHITFSFSLLSLLTSKIGAPSRQTELILPRLMA